RLSGPWPGDLRGRPALVPKRLRRRRRELPRARDHSRGRTSGLHRALRGRAGRPAQWRLIEGPYTVQWIQRSTWSVQASDIVAMAQLAIAAMTPASGILTRENVGRSPSQRKNASALSTIIFVASIGMSSFVRP